ncbi:MAG: PPC domain-containing protein [Verrucomicrobiae bacterium]|nr:PPC domain-containing protein [Verrucomicrobiae bacterium]
MTHSIHPSSHPSTPVSSRKPFLAAVLFGLALGTHPAAADDGNTLGSATPVPPGSYEADLTGGDVDWFSFSVTSTGLVAIFTQGATDTKLEVYNSAGTNLYLTTDNRGGGDYNFEKVERFLPGTYYLKVSAGRLGSPTGPYTLTLRTQESAPLVTSSGFTGYLTRGQIDFVKVPVERQGLLEVYTTGSTDTDGELYNSSGTSLYHNRESGGAGYNFLIQRESQIPGEYLFLIRGGRLGTPTGPYEGFVLRPSLAEPVTEGAYPHSLTPLGDIDHFVCTVETAGEVRFWTTGTTDTKAWLYNSAGTQLYPVADSGGTGDNYFLEKSLDPGIYYLRVAAGGRGSGSGDYVLHLDLPGVASPASLQRAALVRKLAIAKKKLRVSRSAATEKGLKRSIATLLRRLRSI